MRIAWTRRMIRLLLVLAATSLLALTACSGDGANEDTGGDARDASGETELTDVDATSETSDDAGDLDSKTDDPGPEVETTPETAPDVDLDEDSDPGVLNKIEFLTPTAGQALEGSVRVEVVPVGVEEWLVDELIVTLNGEPIFSDTKLPTWFVLDTTVHPNGPSFMEGAARIQEDYSVTNVSFDVQNASFRFLRVFPRNWVHVNGDPVEIAVDLKNPGVTLTADFSALDSEYQPDLVNVTDHGDGTYQIVYAISPANTFPDGDYAVPLVATGGGHTIEYGGTRVRLQNRTDIPLVLLGGIYVDHEPPAVGADEGQRPSMGEVSGNETIIAGGTASLAVAASDPQGVHEVVGVVVQVEGYHGYYQMPVELFAGQVEMVILLSTLGGQEVDFDEVTLSLSAIDAKGHRSEPTPYTLNVNHQAQSGEVQVSVSWDSPSDVDLHVIEPGGEEIYYGHKTSATGGQLDLDSNPACGIDGVNNENVTWATDSPEGTYQVLVDYFSNCSIPSAGGEDVTHYIVTVKNCGINKTYEGGFTPNEADSGGSGSGELVCEFDSNCGSYVYGTIRFEEQTFDAGGYRARSWKSVRHARVEVRRQSDNVVLGTAYTDRLGQYGIWFANDGAPGVYVIVAPETHLEEGLRHVSVQNHPKFGVVYSYAAPAFEDEDGLEYRVDVDVPEEHQDLPIAGAFNIFDVVVSGHDLIRLITGRDLGEIEVFWKTCADVTETSYCSKTRYEAGQCTLLGSLSIKGRDEDRDEYDDCVILQEVFRYAHDQLSISDDPGGYADGSRDNPLRAWGNGASMFFAAHTLEIPFFLNRNRFGVYRIFDLESMASPFAFRTKDGTMSGRVSEYLVASALWDLADGGDADDDGVSAQGLGIYDTIFHYLNNPILQDRGAVGRDLVDFHGPGLEEPGENIVAV